MQGTLELISGNNSGEVLRTKVTVAPTLPHVSKILKVFQITYERKFLPRDQIGQKSRYSRVFPFGATIDLQRKPQLDIVSFGFRREQWGNHG